MLIDVPCAMQSSIAGRPGIVAGIFTIRFGRSTSRRDPARLLERPLGVVGEPGLDLHRDVAVAPLDAS